MMHCFPADKMTSAISLRLALLALVGLASSARALDLPIGGGRSPDGRYELRVGGLSADSEGYHFALVDAANGRQIGTAEVGGGHCDLAGASATAKVLWHPANTFIALTDAGSRHSQELYVFAVSARGLKQVKIPEAVPVGIKREDGTKEAELSNGDFCEPLRWEKDRLVVEVSFKTNDRRGYSCEVILQLQRHRHAAPTMRLGKVTKAKEWE
jgi:hypothetical protein